MRPVPGDSALHRMWAGTKLCLLVVLAFVLGLEPTWPVLAAGAAVVAVGLVAGRIPRGAWPRFPRWLLIGVLLGALVTLRSGVKPTSHLGPVLIGWGGLESFARLAVLAVVVFVAASLVSWTTPLAEVAPALTVLATPLGWLRLPVEEWAVTIALSIRCLPLLVDEMRTLRAARRLRPLPPEEVEGRDWVERVNRRLEELQDLLMTSITVSLRRAEELAEAIEARGGFGPVDRGSPRLGWRDLAAAVVVVAFGAAVFVL